MLLNYFLYSHLVLLRFRMCSIRMSSIRTFIKMVNSLFQNYIIYIKMNKTIKKI